MNGAGMRETLRVTKALADIQRLRILMLLKNGELCVCQIVEVLGLAPSTVSKHLSLLAGAGLVDVRKDGRWSYYRLPDETENGFVRPVLGWLANVLAGDKSNLQDQKKLGAVVSTKLDNLCRQQRRRNK